MGRTYEPTVHKWTTYASRHREETQTPTAGLPGGLRSGDRCPRPGCGGLLVDRCVVSVEGTCQEVCCSSCSRTLLVSTVEPYAPMGEERSRQAEACHRSGRPRGASRRQEDEEEGVMLPFSVDELG